jgi:hypothetical protein
VGRGQKLTGALKQATDEFVHNPVEVLA